MDIGSRRNAALFATSLVAIVSCSDATKLHNVRGTVFFNELPTEGATVVFQPIDGGASPRMPSGIVQADGTFALRTHPDGEGAPEGDYIVLVTWYPPDARLRENAKNKLPARYASPTDSPLRATVKPGKNELEPIRLTR